MANRGRNALQSMRTRMKNIQLFDSRGLDETTRKSLVMVIYGVLFGQVSVFITTGAAWTGFLRDVLHANDLMLGIIAAVPVATNTIQILGAYLMQRYQKRRFYMLFFGILGRFFWIPIALVPYFLPIGMQMFAVTAFVVAVAVGNSFVNLAYASLMADIVPIRLRGRYFASRQAVSLVTGLVGGLVASYLVDSLGMAGYTIALTVAGLTGMADIACFFKVEFPPMDGLEGNGQQGFLASLTGVLRDTGFMRVVLCFTVWTFSVNITGPFYNVHMLENLRMSYTQITLMNQIASNVVTMLCLSRWGRPIDRFGNKAVLQICAHVCMLVPLIWLIITPQSLWLVLVSNFFSGLFWAPIDITQQNFYMGASSSRNRGMYMAVFFAVFNLFGVALSNVLGGVLVQEAFAPLVDNWGFLGQIGWTKYHLIFLLSALLRIAVVVGLFPRLREEEEGIPARAALTTMRQEAVGRWVHLWSMMRASYLRKRYRRKNASENAQNEEDNDARKA